LGKASNKRDYVEVIYNEEDRPFSSYPRQLARYLVDRFQIPAGVSLLDVGCGRGEFLQGFVQCGVRGHGIDASQAAEKVCPQADLKCGDIENDDLPYENDHFDVVFSKSVVEHLYYPEKLFQEIHRILKPGGLVLTLCPAWEFNHRIYFEDYTHRTPFMRSSLRDIQLIHGFKNVNCEFFRQLPLLWRFPWLLLVAEIARISVPSYLRNHSKFVRFSKEIMLLSSANKCSP